MTAEELDVLIREGRAPLILDVRTAYEFRSGHIAGAVHTPMASMIDCLEERGCGRDDRIVITCEHGPRAQMAWMLLRVRGYRKIELLKGHMAHWRQAGKRVVRSG